MMQSKVLLLNRDGQPQDWIHQQDAIYYHSLDKVIYQIGRHDQFVFRGGTNRVSGCVSVLTTAPIIAIDGVSDDKSYKTPAISNRLLFERDGHRCGYCGRRFGSSQLTRDHIIPRSRGGRDSWENIVSCCKYHNNVKDDLTVYEAGLQLLIQPYTPTFAEVLFMREPVTALPIQVEYLLDFIPAESRIRNRALELI